MDRRSFLKTSALGGTAAAAATLAAPAYAQGNRTLTMVTSWPRGFAVLDDVPPVPEARRTGRPAQVIAGWAASTPQVAS